MKTGKKRLTGTLLALCAALLVLCIVLAIGWSKTAKADAVLPEVRNNGTAVQWKYRDETDWRDLVALTELTGAAGENGRDGANGSNGADGKNGINGTNGKDGMNGVDGRDGANGENGTDGKNGINGANGKDGINGIDGTDGQNGIDGTDGVDGKDGVDAKNIEVQRAETHIQWRYEGGEWQNLVAIADIEGPAGQNGTDGANGKTPEFRVSENILQWRYVGDEIWLNLYDLTALKGADGRDGVDGKDGRDGADGTDGQNGSDGKDGKTPFIGGNGNWWIGDIDTAVKAAGIDGTDGVDGTDGEKGEKGDKGDPGDKGDKGDAGQNGSCPGYFYGVGVVQSVNLQNETAALYFQGKMSSGGLVSCDGDTVRLSRGHHYQVSVNGAVYAMSNDDKGFYSVRMTDGYDNQLCRDLTSIKVDKGKKLNETRREQHTLSFNRVYDAKGGDIVLRLALEQAEYATYLLSFRGTITITALD